MKGSWRLMLIAVMLASVAAGPAPRAGRRGSASAPAADTLTPAAVAAAREGTLAEFQKTVEQELRSALVSTDEKDLPRLTRLAALRQFARYFAGLNRKELERIQINTLEWLPTQPNLLNTLMLAVEAGDLPQDVLAVLTALRLAMPQIPEQFPDLATAMCVVWDSPQQQRGQPRSPALSVERPVQLMRYYTNARGQLQFDSRNLPWPLATYMVDNVVTEEEIAWALGRYAKRGAIGRVYFDVPYDYNIYYGTGVNVSQARNQMYTLQNLALFGGVCADQAYFATQVSRSVGVPAATAAGRGATGAAAHAWVGYLEIRGNKAVWNWDAGRYPEYQFFKGRVVDPQTREALTETDISLQGELYTTPAPKRLGSLALCRVADLVEESGRAALLMKAVDYSPGNRDAWLELADLGARQRLTEPQRRSLKLVVQQYAAKTYPDFAFTVLTHAVSGKSVAEQLRELDEIRGMFPANRPDIQAELSAAKGDLLLRDNRRDEALAAYGAALSAYASIGPIAMEMLEKIDDLLRQTDALPRLAAIYQFVWGRMAQPETSAYIQTTPYYIIGTRYQAVLREAGDTNTAALVQQRLDSMTAATTSAQPTRRR